jgi:hypothetical protein
LKSGLEAFELTPDSRFDAIREALVVKAASFRAPLGEPLSLRPPHVRGAQFRSALRASEANRHRQGMWFDAEGSSVKMATVATK